MSVHQASWAMSFQRFSVSTSHLTCVYQHISVLHGFQGFEPRSSHWTIFSILIIPFEFFHSLSAAAGCASTSPTAWHLLIYVTKLLPYLGADLRTVVWSADFLFILQARTVGTAWSYATPAEDSEHIPEGIHTFVSGFALLDEALSVLRLPKVLCFISHQTNVWLLPV